MLILAADLGGTNVRFRVADKTDGKVVVNATRNYPSAQYDSFESVLQKFIDEIDPDIRIDSACIAVAGPVSGAQAKITNLPWKIDATSLRQYFNIDRIRLINDFQGVAYGITHLHEDELVTLKTGKTDQKGLIGVIGAGTGLGHAMILRDGDRMQVLASEAGHMEFSSRNDLESQLADYIRRQGRRASCEAVLSGPGLVTIYRFLRDSGIVAENDKVASAMKTSDAARVISDHAWQGDPLAGQALELFMSCYGSHCGNMALAWLPRGGLYLAGSIAPGNIEIMKNGRFMQAFLDKAPMDEMLATLPVYVVMCDDTGLRGALYLAGGPA